MAQKLGLAHGSPPQVAHGAAAARSFVISALNCASVTCACSRMICAQPARPLLSSADPPRSRAGAELGRTSRSFAHPRVRVFAADRGEHLARDLPEGAPRVGVNWARLLPVARRKTSVGLAACAAQCYVFHV